MLLRNALCCQNNFHVASLLFGTGCSKDLMIAGPVSRTFAPEETALVPVYRLIYKTQWPFALL